MHNVYVCLCSISIHNFIRIKRVISFRHEMKPPLCFTSHKKFFDRSYVFFDNLSPHFISGLQINCSSHYHKLARPCGLQWHNILTQVRRNRTLDTNDDKGNTQRARLCQKTYILSLGNEVGSNAVTKKVKTRR